MRRSVVGVCFVALVVVVGLGAAPAQAATTGFRFVDITASEGVVLKANVIEPTSAGRHPAIVLPSSWSVNDLEYVVQATKLAEAGYTVVSYTPRGWWLSGGQIDTAGPKDIADVSKVLDWAIANTTADPAKIGMAGVSYGAGISLIASGHDSRVRVVGALSGWTDLEASLYGGQTRRLQSSAFLTAAGVLVGRPSDEFYSIIGDFLAYRNIEGVKAFARKRSAATYLAGINANRPAILMANAYGDSIFPPNQMVDFYNALGGSKRLEFARGDHAIPEATGLVGLDNHVWTSLRQWFDRHLKGEASGIADGVVLRSMNADSTESYPNWGAINTSTRRMGLGEVNWWNGTGELGATETGWSRGAWLGPDTVANGGVVFVSNAWQALTGVPPTAWLPAVDRNAAGVWISDGTSMKIRGAAQVHARISPNQSTGTLVAYLYDVDWAGTGRLISHAPISWRAGGSQYLDFRLPAVSWDVPSGHKVALVLDGADGLYLDDNGLTSSVQFSGPSWVDVPVR